MPSATNIGTRMARTSLHTASRENMIQTSDSRQTQPIEHNILAAARPIIFYPTPQSARRTSLRATLLLILALLGSILLALAAWRFEPTYTHPFTPYLKWQDALLATLCYGSFILLIASIVLARFQFACRRGSRQGIFILHSHGTFAVRDISPKNLHAIYDMVGSSFACFLITLIGLFPFILIGWTLHISHHLLMILTTAIAIAVSLAGLVLSVIFGTFLIIGIIGARALTHALGALHTYQLTPLTTLRVDNNILTITCPNRPETLFDLNLLHPHDQLHLLQLLQHYTSQDSLAQASTSLDQQIEAALHLNYPPLSV